MNKNSENVRNTCSCYVKKSFKFLDLNLQNPRLFFLCLWPSFAPNFSLISKQVCQNSCDLTEKETGKHTSLGESNISFGQICA